MSILREDAPLQKHTLRLYKGDFEKLKTIYPDKGMPTLVLRRMLRAYLRKIESGTTNRVPESDIDI